MLELAIELAVEADLARIVAISNWAAEHTSANFATAPESEVEWRATWRAQREAHPWLVARSARDGVLGFARSSPHKSRGAYAWSAEVSVYLDPSVHGRGVGTGLYTRLLALLEAQGYATLIAGVTAGHVASERLHAKMGFVRCATFHRVGFKRGSWHDVGYWEKHLFTGDGPPRPIRCVSEVA